MKPRRFFVWYWPCGVCLRGASVDSGQRKTGVDTELLLDAIREGCSVGMADSVVNIRKCDCQPEPYIFRVGDRVLERAASLRKIKIVTETFAYGSKYGFKYVYEDPDYFSAGGTCYAPELFGLATP